MKIYHNPHARELIVTKDGYAFAVYLKGKQDPHAHAQELVARMADYPMKAGLCKLLPPETDPICPPDEEKPQPEFPFKSQPTTDSKKD